MSRMGASVSPPLAKSTYPRMIAAAATAHHPSERDQRGRTGGVCAAE